SGSSTPGSTTSIATVPSARQGWCEGPSGASGPNPAWAKPTTRPSRSATTRPSASKFSLPTTRASRAWGDSGRATPRSGSPPFQRSANAGGSPLRNGRKRVTVSFQAGRERGWDWGRGRGRSRDGDQDVLPLDLHVIGGLLEPAAQRRAARLHVELPAVPRA